MFHSKNQVSPDGPPDREEGVLRRSKRNYALASSSTLADVVKSALPATAHHARHPVKVSRLKRICTVCRSFTDFIYGEAD
jgi:hypothetical protein